VLDNIKTLTDPSSVGGVIVDISMEHGKSFVLRLCFLPSEGGIKLLGDLQLGSGISSTLPNEEEGACILG